MQSSRVGKEVFRTARQAQQIEAAAILNPAVLEA